MLVAGAAKSSGMDIERAIDDIEQLEEMFEAPDTRPLNPSDLAAANRRHDEMLAHSPWFRHLAGFWRQLPSGAYRTLARRD